MRSSRRLNPTKSTYKPKANKKRYKSRSTLGFTKCVSILDIENINEILRVHKSQRADGKGSWKVVPKDSCEVYKNRRKRQAGINRQDDDDDTNMRTTDSERTTPRGKKNQRRPDDKKGRKEAVKKTRRRRKPKRRREPNSSISSFTTTTTSCMSSSEMDYD